MGYKTIDASKGKKFAVGQSGQHTTRPMIPPELRGIKKLNSDVVRRLITKCFDMSMSEVEARSDDPSAPALELAILSCLTKAISTGNYTNVMYLMDRVIGKVKEAAELDAYYDEELDAIPPSELSAYLRARMQKPAVITLDEE